jgi:hypothetical protein
LRYYVRPQNYFQKCLDLEVYVKKLETQLEKKPLNQSEDMEFNVKQIIEKEYLNKYEEHEDDQEEHREQEKNEFHQESEKKFSEKKEIQNVKG